MLEARARVIAFYLPQFHPTPENDDWWGRGFTEWTNVTRSRPLFEGHYQPHLPTNLGFCDLRLPEVRAAQARLAAEHGIEAFCYWHYWFEGRRLLDRPFAEVLDSGQPEFPFCLAWANESWSRRWLGEERDILMPQTYSDDDALAHARWASAAFADERYVRVHGRPLFLVYRPFDLPDPNRTTDIFRSECVRLGVGEPWLVGINAHAPHLDARPAGFDANLDFRPQLAVVNDVAGDGLKVLDYVHGVKLMDDYRLEIPAIPSVFVSWDNTARRGNAGVVFTGSSPEAFEEVLRPVVDEVAAKAPEERLLFVNAWNEWAEGNHLEPDRRHGLGYLDVIRRAVFGAS